MKKKLNEPELFLNLKISCSTHRGLFH